MKEIIQKIYYMETEETEKLKIFQTTENNFAKIKAHEALFKTLSDKQKTLFLEYEDASSVSHCDDNKNYYEHGFKSGFTLALELMEN